jgi:NADH-quinone oxidoreductase subunit M
VIVATDPGVPVLTVMVLLPAVGALVVALMPKTRGELLRPVALLFSAAAGAFTIYVLASFETGVAGYQFETDQSWISSLGISWHLGVDGISLFLVVLTGILFPIALLATDPSHDNKAYFAWLLLLEAGCLGAFVALDLFVFFVFFEIVLVPMYFLIGQWGHGNRIYAATKFFLYTMLGSALMLVGILSLVFIVGDATDGITFDLVRLSEVTTDPSVLSPTTATWIFAAFAVAFAVKVPLFPLHTWLPDAHTEAPTAGSVILAAIMLKLGTYGFIRFAITLFPDAAVDLAPVLLTVGVIGIVYAAVIAAVQKDLKRLVAYSSIAHLGFIVLGTFAFTSQGVQGSVLQMVNHGLSTGALFLLVGMIYERRHTRQIAELGGLQKPAPIMAAVFTVVMLSSIGLPGLNGFVGEFLILIGSFATARWWTVVATSGVILAALYLLWAYQRVFQGPAEGENAEMSDMNLREMLVMAPLLALIVFLGVYPKPALDRIEPAVDQLVERVEVNSDFTQPAVTVEGPGAVEIQPEDEPADHGEGEG